MFSAISWLEKNFFSIISMIGGAYSSCILRQEVDDAYHDLGQEEMVSYLLDTEFNFHKVVRALEMGFIAI